MNILILTARTYPYQQNGDCFKGAISRVWQLQPQNRRPDANRNAHRLPVSSLWCGYRVDWGVSASTLSGEDYLDFPIEGNSIKNDGLNRLITVVTALTYPYTKNRHCFTGAIPWVTRLPVPGVLWGWRSRSRYRQRDPTATHNCGPCQVCGGGMGGGGISASTLSK